ncbi:MAG: glycine cleavage system aminomethyltransferase GcvT [Caldisericaceae bacterium]|nr:glycine cleavage system aminomethyltransferase GcvT [Caldisericaceae bacterium]
MEDLKRTPLFEEHVRLGAKMVPFGGWEMPIQYTSIIEEHLNVRNNVGIFDVSHMGEIELHGKDALAFADYLVTNSVKKMKDGKVKYTPMCYPDGGEVDDLFVYKLKDDFVLLVVNASNYEKDLDWVIKNKGEFDVEILGKSFEYGEVAIQGPKAEEFLKNYFEGEIPLPELGYFRSEYGTLFGKNILISRTGYTGEDGFEIYSKSEDIVEIWRAALEKGKDYNIMPAGLGARDTLRFEVAYWLYGDDIDETTNPFEAGQGFAVKLKKEKFIGKDALLKVKEEGLKRKLVGLYVSKGGIPRHGMGIFKDLEKIGYITSGNYCPSLKKIYAMGYVDIRFTDEGTKVKVKIRNRDVDAEIVKLPFLEPRAGKKK